MLFLSFQKLMNGTKVYGDALAKKLAKEDPGKAGRSAENYENCCLTF